MLLQDLANHIGATLYLPDGCPLPQTPIKNLAPLHTARPGEVTFLTSPHMRPLVAHSQATALITKEPIPTTPMAQLIHANPQAAMAKTIQLFYHVQHPHTGQSPLAHIDPSAHVDPSVRVSPWVYIDRDAYIDAHCVLYPFVYIGPGCHIGPSTVLYPQVTLMAGTHIGSHCILHGGSVLGADGFGFAPTKEGLEKIPQRGKVVLEDEVEVGALTTIDRATFEETRIRKGSKLDSHVHVGHNVDLGERSMLCAFTGIAGSTKIGKGFIAAGQAGVGPGLEIGDHIVVGAQAGLVTSESEPGEYFGMPASRGKHWHKQMLALKQLPELLKTVKKLEHQINALRSSHT